MLNYSTCRQCGGVLAISFVGQESHPTCPQTEAEKLAQEFVAAVQRHDEPEASRLEKLVNKPDPPKPLIKSALWYAQQGWPVFPLLPGKKEPATQHGFKDASTDLAGIHAWWSKHPDANIGLATGWAFDVVDVDGPTGIKSLSELPEGTLPDIHGKVATPNGMHLYIRPTGDSNAQGFRPGIDYRGKGGYVVAPPSQIDFKRYKWVIQPSPEIRNADK